MTITTKSRAKLLDETAPFTERTAAVVDTKKQEPPPEETDGEVVSRENAAPIQPKAKKRRPEPRLPPLRFLRFNDLMAMGLVRNYPALERLIKHHAFPVGRWLGSNTRCWTVDEVEKWIANRPVERPVPATERQAVR